MVSIGTVEIEGHFPGLRSEAGGHRVQRVPSSEKRGRVHTSTVTVSVQFSSGETPGMIDDRDLKIDWFSGTGKGGQHRNKHQCSCRITHIPSGISKKAETRSRESSLREARDALLAELTRRAVDSAHSIVNDDRRAQIGSGMRGDKRRTYRFQDDHVHDHVTGKRSTCSRVMRGSFKELW